MNKEAQFQDSWLYEDKFQEWLLGGKENIQPKFRLCQKIIELLNMGIQALMSHAAGKKHLQIEKELRTVERQENKKPESIAEKGPKKCTQISLELTFASSEVAKAEFRWASNDQNASISTLF